MAKLDELAASSEAFADQPWVSILGVTVRAAFGCIEVETGSAPLPANPTMRLPVISESDRGERHNTRT